MQVKTADVVAKKWATNAGAAGANYQAGIQSTQKDWATDTAAAAGSWATGVSNAASNGSFAKGVNTAGTAKWKANATSKGVQRYPGGIQAGTPAYQAGIGPVLQTLASLTLPPRGAKGDPANLQRVQAIATALRKLKTG